MGRLKLNNEKIDERLVGRSITRISDYVSMTTKIQWKCNVCHYTWITTPNNVINNHTGCRSCSQSMIAFNPTTLQRLHDKCIIPVGDIKTAMDKTAWRCLVCNHEWITTPTSLLDNGSGCPKCAGSLVDVGDINQRLAGRHVELISQYINMSSNAEWKCTICQHTWTTTPNNVINANTRCPKCSKRYSLLENDWLDYVGVPNTPQHRQVVVKINGKRFRVDGYIPATNTIYEFWGDYWHGNPVKYAPHAINGVSKQTFRELLDRTNAKRQLIRDAGYNLIEIWETDWNNQKKSH